MLFNGLEHRRVAKRRKRKIYSFVSLFSGCGGLDLGFQRAGLEGLAAFDFDDDAVLHHRLNLGIPSYLADLSDPKWTIPAIGRVDVVSAGPPCQGYSTVGLRRLDDPRNGLLVRAAEIASGFSPRVIVIENVAGAVSGKHQTFWERAQEVLNTSGYKTATIHCRACDHGVAQLRRRVFLIAWKNNSSSCPQMRPSFHCPVLRDVIGGVERLRNHEPIILPVGSRNHRIAQVIRQNQKLSNVRRGERYVRTWDIPSIFGPTTAREKDVLEAICLLRRRERLRTHGDADPVTIGQIARIVGPKVNKEVDGLVSKGFVRKVGRRYDLVSTFNGKFWRLAWDGVAPTVDTRFGEPRYFLHPEEDRGFSVREAARIQGFPDAFAFQGSLRTQYRLVGNAVPPPVAERLAKLVVLPLLDV
jgi:DNA (cytosine-5)-methyltransferase 1